MVRRNLARSRTEAQQLISAGSVVVKGIPTPKPASLVTADTPITLSTGEKRWVSRGAYKLLGALAAFPIGVSGKRALDVGASTGGFTEVLLDSGAAQVVALDVGRAQLHETLLADERVRSVERTNFRHVDVADLGGPFELVVADLSFISLCTVAGKLTAMSSADADVVVLVKPQFEASRSEVGRGGLIKDQAIRDLTVQRVIGCLGEEGLNAQGLIQSPIKGGDGNVEYLLWLRKDRVMVDLEVPS